MARRNPSEHGSATAGRTLSRPQVYLLRMLVFLMLIGFLGAILYTPASRAFMANPGLNGLILGVLAIGILYAFRQVIRLYPEIYWVNNFHIGDPVLEERQQPTLLAPMANLLRDRRSSLALSSSTMRSIMDSIGSRLDEARDTARYLVGLLIFLGLLGTFWGLLETINSVGNTISSLSVGGGDSGVIFEELKSGLEAPLKGMGTAFSSSLFGLAGSLVLGFLDLQANQAQNRFYNELEEWLADVTQIETAGGGEGVPAQLRFALVDMQRSIIEMGDKIEAALHETARPANGGVGSDEAVRELAGGIEKLVRQMRAEQKVVREWVDEQAAQQAELSQVLRQLHMHLNGRG